MKEQERAALTARVAEILAQHQYTQLVNEKALRCGAAHGQGDGQKIAGHASKGMTRNHQRDHEKIIWSEAAPDLNISEITGWFCASFCAGFAQPQKSRST